jgi:uncharacterized protein (DUF433 family)
MCASSYSIPLHICVECGLTTRSTGPATASAGSPVRGTWCIIAYRAYGACLRRPVSSNVRPHTNTGSATILSMIDWSSCPAVERDPARMSGAWVFRGTRVPIAALFENLEDDASVHQFLEWFPGVSLEQARSVLEHAARSSLAVA